MNGPPGHCCRVSLAHGLRSPRPASVPFRLRPELRARDWVRSTGPLPPQMLEGRDKKAHIPAPTCRVLDVVGDFTRTTSPSAGCPGPTCGPGH